MSCLHRLPVPQQLQRPAPRGRMGRAARLPRKLDSADQQRLRECLKAQLAIRDTAYEQLVSIYPALEQMLVDDVIRNVCTVRQLSGGCHEQARSLIFRHPALLAAPVQSWYEFLTAYGLAAGQFQHLLRHSSHVITSSSVYKAGCVLQFLKQMGWKDDDILSWLTLHPHILDLERAELQQMVDWLCSIMPEEDVRRLLRSNPQILSRDYRNKIRLLQHWG